MSIARFLVPISNGNITWPSSTVYYSAISYVGNNILDVLIEIEDTNGNGISVAKLDSRFQHVEDIFIDKAEDDVTSEKAFNINNWLTEHGRSSGEINTILDLRNVICDAYNINKEDYFLCGKHLPNIFSLPAISVSHNRSLISISSTLTKSNYLSMISSADTIINNNILYSVMDKTQVPPSGDKHDYFSQSRYYWPDPESETGYPYIYLDGQVNPEIYTIPDREEFFSLVDDVLMLTLTYYLSNKLTYASFAATLIKTWFLSLDTKMNPNMENAETKPGYVNTTHGSGIISLRDIALILDCVTIICDLTFNSIEINLFKNWLLEYIYWLENSIRGKNESVSPSNHGTWYLAQLASIKMFLGDIGGVLEIIDKTKILIDNFIIEDGSQPNEVIRTNAWFYSNFDISAFMRLCLIANKLNIDLLNYESATGKTLTDAINFLIPYAQSEGVGWPYQQLDDWDNDEIKKYLYYYSVLKNDKTNSDIADSLTKTNLKTCYLLSSKYY